MDKITNMLNVWDNGAIGDYLLDFDDIVEFKKQTGATKVVARRWNYRKINHETSHFVQLLPDGASLVYATEDFKTLVVLNGDNTVRCEIVPPVLSHDVSKIDASIYRSNKNDPRTARPFLVYPPTPEIALAMRPEKRNGHGSLSLPQAWGEPAPIPAALHGHPGLAFPLSLGRDSLCGISYGCKGNEDGEGEPYVFEFDWNTGALLKAVHMPRTW